MRKIAFDKSHILLWVILALFLSAIIVGVVALKAESLSMQLKTDRPINVLLIFQQGGKPVSTQLLMFYASKSKAALLDIPANTAVILKTIKRMDRIDYIYKAGNPKNFMTEVSSYLDIPLNGYLLFDEKSLSNVVDLLDGLQLFIPSMIIQEGEEGVMLPGGAVNLDGDKVLQYLRYKEENESEGDALVRRQKLSIALLKKLSDKSRYFDDRKASAVLVSALDSNFNAEAKRMLFREIARLDADSILLQKITGMYRSVEGDSLFFPFYDGELARDMLKQTLNAMNASNVASSSSKIYTVEILNGTSERGLAARTAEIFGSFGYDVVAVGNAETLDYAKTVLIDRFGDKEALTSIAGVIKCTNFSDAAEYRGKIKADYTIVLGKDFNGRVCVR
ncbi:MAG TPA: LCP family protein [Rectinemataceae bacterium]|nr:LCP family protein [Rectinemataceae bacterium]